MDKKILVTGGSGMLDEILTTGWIIIQLNNDKKKNN